MHQPPLIGAGSGPPKLTVQSIDVVPFTVKVRGATKFPQTRPVTTPTPTTSSQVAPVPRFPEFILAGMLTGLVHSPAQGPVPPPDVPAAPPEPVVPEPA